MKTKNKSLFKNICLIILSTLFLVLSVLGLIVNIDIKNKTREMIFADSTTTNFYGSSFYLPVNLVPSSFYTNGDFLMSKPNNLTVGTTGTNSGYAFFDFNGTIINTTGSSNKRRLVFSDDGTFTLSNVFVYLTNTTTSINFYGNNFLTDSTGSYIFFQNNSSAKLYKFNYLDDTSSTWKFYFDEVSNYTGPDTYSSALFSLGYKVINNVMYYINNNVCKYFDTSTMSWVTLNWNIYNSSYGNCYGIDLFSFDNINFYLFNSYRNIMINSSNTVIQISSTSILPFGRFVFTFNTMHFAFTDGYYYRINVPTIPYNLTIDYFTLTGVPDRITYINSLIYNNTYYMFDAHSVFIWRADIGVSPNNIDRAMPITFISTRFTFVSSNSGIYFSHNSIAFIREYNSTKFYTSSVFNEGSHSSPDVNDFVDSYFISFTDNTVGHTFYIPFYFNGQYYQFTLHFSKGNVNNTRTVSSCDFTQVDFSGSSGSPNNNIVRGTNYIGYTARNSDWFNFSCEIVVDANSHVINYNGDDTNSILDYIGTTNNIFVFNSRVYFFSDDTPEWQNAYNSGYNDGYEDGNRAGETAGYNNGYEDGNRAGLTTGYNNGVNAANEYTFFNFIGAVIDAPISVIFGHLVTDTESPLYMQRVGGLLNFNLFGVNLTSFIMSLFTIAIIIVIIKKVV